MLHKTPEHALRKLIWNGYLSLKPGGDRKNKEFLRHKDLETHIVRAFSKEDWL